MPCPSLKQIQRTIIRIVDASPVALLLLIFSWSFWAYLFSLCLGLIKEGNTLHGSNIIRVVYVYMTDLGNRSLVHIFLYPTICLVFMELLDGL